MKKKIIRWSILLFLICVTFLAFFYAEENWREGHAWKKEEAALRAKGEPLTLAELVPPEIPDGLNMAMAPLWKDVQEVDSRKNAGGNPEEKPRIAALKLISATNAPMPRGSSFQRGELFDLKAWALYLGASDEKASSPQAVEALQKKLAEQDALVREATDSLRRPKARWPLKWEDGFGMHFPHLTPCLDLAKFYHLRAIVFLEAGNEKAAYEDLESMWRLADSFQPENSLISGLVALTIDNISLNVVWEGLARDAWSHASLLKIQEVLGRPRTWDRLLNSLRGERALFLDFAGKIKAGDFTLIQQILQTEPQPLGPGHIALNLYLSLRPQGWIEADKTLYVQSLQPGIEWILDVQKKDYAETLPDFDQLNNLEGSGWAVFYKKLKTPLTFVALPSILASNKKGCEYETFRKLALISCAIERYQMSNGRLPEDLAVLLPDYLETIPTDTIQGKPLNYVIKGEKAYLLYSRGWNEKDEGGYTAKDRKGGDWVWPSGPGLVDVRDH